MIEANRIHAHMGKNMCVCLSFLCEPMMWQSSMLISPCTARADLSPVRSWVTRQHVGMGIFGLQLQELKELETH